MSNALTKEDKALLERASEMFEETGCLPGFNGEEVPAETMVPNAKEYIGEIINDPEALYDPEIWDTPGFTLVLSLLAQKWHRRCRKLAPHGNKSPEQYLTQEQKKVCLDSAAAELIRRLKENMEPRLYRRFSCTNQPQATSFWLLPSTPVLQRSTLSPGIGCNG